MRLAFDGAINFPAGRLRVLLAQLLPELTWTCGEDDDLSPQCSFPIRREVLVRGSGGGHSLFVVIRAETGAAEAPHGLVLTIDPPTTDLPGLPDRLRAVIAVALTEGESAGRGELAPGAGWLDARRLRQALAGVVEGQSLTRAAEDFAAVAVAQPAAPVAPASAGSGGPGRTSDLARLPFDDLIPHERSKRLGYDVIGLAQTERSMAEAMQGTGLAEISGFAPPPAFAGELTRRDRLPTLMILYDSPPTIDWAKLGEGLASIDPQGNWQVLPGQGLTGRGARIALEQHGAPIPAYLTEIALWRSFWCKSGEPLRRLRHHRCWLSIASDLDCETVDYADVRQTAKAMVMTMAVLSKAGPCAGIHVPALGSIFTEDHLNELVGPLFQDEVPIRLFVWNAFHSTQSDAISLSSAGMLPFVGREVEVWNAPGTLEFVGEKLNGLLRYLLINGPVMRDGDTIGAKAGDRSVQVFHGESDQRSARPQPVPVLLMEFAGPDRAERPRPDPAVPALDGNPQAAMLLAALKADASPAARVLLEELEELIANPPPREVIEGPDNPIAKLLLRWIELEQDQGTLPGGAAPAAPWEPPLNTVTLVSLVAVTRGIGYPRDILAEWLPKMIGAFKWTVEPAEGMAAPRAVLGEMPGKKVAIWIDARAEALPRAIPAPQHRAHVRVAIDTGRDVALARRISLVVCSCLLIGQDKQGHFQVDAVGNWLTHEEATAAISVPRHVNDIRDFDRQFGLPLDKLRGGNWLPDSPPPSTDGLERLHAATRIDLPGAAAAPPPAAGGFGRRVAGGGFGRKGL